MLFRSSGKKAFRHGRMLKLVEKTNGYLCVTLTDGSKRPQLSVHRVVARTFLGECPMGLHVLHNDGNKYNNNASNLRYGTPAENISDTARHGRRRFGERHPSSKLTERDVIEIRQSLSPLSMLAKKFGVSASHIQAVRSRRIWRHI